LPAQSDYRSLSVVGGTAYVFSNDGNAPLLTVVGVAAARPLPLRPTDDKNWYIYRGLVTADGATAFVSYHGSDTTGIDVIGLDPQPGLKCVAAPPSTGCIATHGDIEFWSDALLAATGEGPLRSYGSDLRVLREYDPQLPRNHLMEFTVAGDTAYAVGPCGYSGGLSAIDLRSGRTRVVVAAGSREATTVCGWRVAAAGAIVVVAHDAVTGDEGLIVAVESSGELRWQARTAAPVRDVLIWTDP
jgi:hypothetical protein